jgi:hypothetical protein
VRDFVAAWDKVMNLPIASTLPDLDVQVDRQSDSRWSSGWGGTAGGSRNGLNRNMMWRDIESRSPVVRKSTTGPPNGALLTLKRLLAATVLLVIAVIVPVAAAHAQGVEGTRSVTLFVGTGLSLAGNAINEAVGTIDGKPSVLSNRPSATTSATR